MPMDVSLPRMEQLLPDVLDGVIQSGEVFDRAIRLDGTSDGFRAMADREALKVLIWPSPSGPSS